MLLALPLCPVDLLAAAYMFHWAIPAPETPTQNKMKKKGEAPYSFYLKRTAQTVRATGERVNGEKQTSKLQRMFEHQ